MTDVTIAYEPIWAIGTGQAATADQAANAHLAIRSFLEDRWSADIAKSTRILYGGSVTSDNVGAFLQSEQIDGALIGGACLHVESFVTIGAVARAITDRG
jgi:triosephosphate isomerase